MSRIEKTARYGPIAPVRKRSHTISMPMPAKPVSASAAAVSATAWREPSSAGGAASGASGAAGAASTERPARAAITRAAIPTATSRPAEASCVRHRPIRGTSAKSVRKQPSAAPAVLTP